MGWHQGRGSPRHPLPRTLVNVSTSSTLGTSVLALVPWASLGEGQGDRWAWVSPPWGVPIPAAGHSRGPVPCHTEISPGKGQHGAGPCSGRELLTTVSLRTLREGAAGGGHLRSRAVGTGHCHHRAGDGPMASTHLSFPVQLLSHGGGGHGRGHSCQSCHLALLVPGLLFPLRRHVDEVGGCDGLDVLGGEEPRPAVDGPELPPCARQMGGMALGRQPWGSPPEKPLPGPCCTPSGFQGVWPRVLGGNCCSLALLEHLQGHGAAAGATQGGNHRGASPCLGLVSKRA